MASRTLHRAFISWMAHASTLKRSLMLARHAMGAFSQQSAHRGWCSWAAYVEARQIAVRLVGVAMTSMRHRSLRPALTAWAEQCSTSRRSSLLQRRAQAHLTERGHALATAFRRLGAAGLMRSSLRRAIMAWQSRGKRRGLTSSGAQNGHAADAVPGPYHHSCLDTADVEKTQAQGGD